MEESAEHGQNPVIDSCVTENNKEVQHIRMLSAARRGRANVILSSRSGGNICLFIIYCSAGRRMWTLQTCPQGTSTDARSFQEE